VRGHFEVTFFGRAGERDPTEQVQRFAHEGYIEFLQCIHISMAFGLLNF
jgi:hypothetical protein